MPKRGLAATADVMRAHWPGAAQHRMMCEADDSDVMSRSCRGAWAALGLKRWGAEGGRGCEREGSSS
eukprot:2420614-Rhodomonas_salina.1